jgi:1-acyl-sn-glycerol-3-phosphate acyltransferase
VSKTSKPFKPALYIRSSLYWVISIITLCLVVFSLLLTFPFSVHTRYRVGSLWARSNIVLLKWICNLDVNVIGRENIPTGAAIVMSKHQSTWETYAFQAILPPQLWVLKKELLKIPVFGWGLALLQPIAIDRSAGKKAIDQIIEQGKQKLDQGRWVVIFPEGTRVNPGKKKRFKLGGAILASNVDYPIVPVAHNAGEFWPRHSFVKWPGEVTVVIGEPINGYQRNPEEVNREVETWIETQMEKISDPARWNR